MKPSSEPAQFSFTWNRTDKMDTDFLLNFVEVVEYGSIAEVARKRSLTPAAINQRIRKVEDELGFRLLVRSGHTVTATPEATQILAQARRILDDLRMLKAASHGPMVFGRVSIGAFDSAMTTLIPKLMTKLIGRYPNLEISLVKGYSTNLYAKVQDGEVDAAVIVQPQFQLPKNLEWRRLRDEPLVVLAPAALTETDPNQLLRGNPLVCYDRKLWGGQLATNYFREHNIKPKIRIEAASIEVIALLVSQGLGVSLIPDWSGDLLHELPLRKVALAQSQYVRSVGLLWNCHSARADLIEQIYAMAVAPA